jgi:hypothetical protein
LHQYFSAAPENARLWAFQFLYDSRRTFKVRKARFQARQANSGAEFENYSENRTCRKGLDKK